MGVIIINTRKIGGKYENKAADYLESKGMTIIIRNFCCRAGEIDIIADDAGTVVFVEVKYRKKGDYGHPGEAITAKKQLRIYRAASFYILRNGMSFDRPYRFDAVLMTDNEIIHIKNAFGGI